MPNTLVRLALLLTAVPALTGCDIVQGFQDAGDSLFPPQKTYLETPGFQLAPGGFRRLNVGIGDELYLLARSSSDTEPALYSMRFVDPEPCKIDGVVRYWSSGLPTDHPAQILYFESDVSRGTLRFADARCRLHEGLTREDAGFPIEEGPLGLVIPAGDELLLVDPPKGSVRTIIGGVQGVLLNGPGAHLVLVGGRLAVFRIGTWQLAGWAGEGVVAIRGVGGAYLFEDSTGIHQLSVIDLGSTLSVQVSEIDSRGCRLGWVSGGLVAYHSPCSEERLAVWSPSLGRRVPIDFDAHPAFFQLERDPERDTQSPSPSRDYFYYALRDVQPDGSGTLVVRPPGGDEFVVGTGARLERTDYDAEREHGRALVDVVGEAGRLVRWHRDGSVETLAMNVLNGPSDIVVDWNGTVGNRARLTKDGDVEVVLERVPRRDYEYQDEQGRWTALFHDSDGVTGTLSIDAAGSRTFATKRAIARRVRHTRHRFLDVVLPGIAFIADYDAETDTGTLEYANLELDFRALVSEGVSDFIPAGNGILYTVPFGSARGVWLARAQ